MYETEFNGALQAIAESISEQEFDSIVEGASILLTENADMAMDEAMVVAAATLFNEDAIGADAFAVTDAVIDEFANNRPVEWTEGLNAIAEAVGEETLNQIMSETVASLLDVITEAYKRDGLENAWQGAKAQGMTKKEFIAQMGLDQKGTRKPAAAPTADDRARKNQADKQKREQETAAARARLSAKLAEKKEADMRAYGAYARSAGKADGYVQGHADGKAVGKTEGLAAGMRDGFNSGYAKGAKAGGAAGERKGYTAGNSIGMKKGAAIGIGGTLAAGAAAFGAKKLYDKIQDDKAAKATKAAEEAKLSNRVKAKIEEGKAAAGEAVEKVKEKLSPKNEDASGVYTLRDLRAMVESVQTAADYLED